MSTLATPGHRHEVVVVGEALADVFAHGAVLGGAPFNVARTLAGLGVPTRLVTRVGTDALGDRVQAEMDRFGLPRSSLQRDTGHPTGVVRVHMSGTDHRFEILQAQAYDHIDANEALQGLGDQVPALVCFGTLAQRTATSRAAITAVVERCPGLRFLDLNLRDTAWQADIAAQAMQLATVVKLNDDELAQVLAWFVHPGSAPAPWHTLALEQTIAALMQRFSLSGLLLTRGSKGSAWFGPGGAAPQIVAGHAAQVVDSVGAGDAFSAVFLLGELAGWPITTRLDRANQFAAAVCGLRGAVSDGLHFYRTWRDRWAAQDLAQGPLR